MSGHDTPRPDRAVFLHTGWRSAGTWLWSRFRMLPEVTAYYEPLHELMAARSKVLLDARAQAWASGHPALDAPYFQEFVPLLQRHWWRRHHWGRTEGVRHFQSDFEMDRFEPEPPHAQALARYLDHLLRHARKRGQVPVLKFCRSMGRMAWMMQRYPEAVHVAVLRHPIDQYASMRTQLMRHDNPGFFEMGLRVLCANRDVPKVARVLAALRCALPDHVAGPAQVRARDASAHYRAFLALWLLQALAVPPQVSAVIDSDALGTDPGYNAEVRARLAGLTGLPVDLSDARARPLVVTADQCEAELGLHWDELADLHDRAVRLAASLGAGPGAQGHHLLPWIEGRLALRTPVPRARTEACAEA